MIAEAKRQEMNQLLNELGEADTGGDLEPIIKKLERATQLTLELLIETPLANIERRKEARNVVIHGLAMMGDFEERLEEGDNDE